MPNVNKWQQGNKLRTQTCKGALSKEFNAIYSTQNSSLRKRQNQLCRNSTNSFRFCTQ